LSFRVANLSQFPSLRKEIVPAKTTPAFDPPQALPRMTPRAKPIVEEPMPGVCCPRALIFSRWESNMKLVGLCSIAVVLGSMTSLAQGSGRNVSQPAVASAILGSMNCPVDMRAQKGLSGQFLQAPVNGQQNSGPSQNLHLTLTNSTYSEIVGVRVTAYGLNANGQLTPAELASSSSSAIEKTVDLKLEVSPKSIGSVDLELTGFTSVTLLNVDSIRYAGGSTWQPTAQRTCHFVPDGTMLISSR
jgi:hypothetical protein